LTPKFERDQAIISALSEGPAFFNELYSKTGIWLKMSRQTFADHLKQLCNENIVIKKPKGKQKQEYSLNHDTKTKLESFLSDINFDKEIANNMLKETENFCIRCKEVQSKKDHFSNKDRNLFFKPAKHVVTLLDGMKLISLLLASGDLPTSFEKTLKNLYSLHETTLQNIFKKTKEVKASLAILVRPGLFVEI